MDRLDDKWTTRDLPVLLAMAAMLDEGVRIDLAAVTDQTSLSRLEISLAVRALDPSI